MDRRDCLIGLAAMFAGACSVLPERAVTAPTAGAPLEPPARQPKRAPRIGLALGGGAARGFAHIGVIKALETNGIEAEIVAGTSAGAVVGSLYAAGHGAFDLQALAFELEKSAVTDWSLFERGWVKGEALERFINEHVGNRPIEQLKRRFCAVATDLQQGRMTAFSSGNTGQAVRASAAVPGVFAPVLIRGVEYVDGGVSSPVPVRVARQMGAELVIAVDISARPSGKRGRGSLDVLLDAAAIMGNRIASVETAEAEIVVRPAVQGLTATAFEDRHRAILEGERAGFAAIAAIKQRIARTQGTA